MKNLYDVLQVPVDADAAAVRAAYLRLAERLHPDRRPAGMTADELNAVDQFKQIQWAYKILSNPVWRNQYDRQPHRFDDYSALERVPTPDGRSDRVRRNMSAPSGRATRLGDGVVTRYYYTWKRRDRPSAWCSIPGRVLWLSAACLVMLATVGLVAVSDMTWQFANEVAAFHESSDPIQEVAKVEATSAPVVSSPSREEANGATGSQEPTAGLSDTEPDLAVQSASDDPPVHDVKVKSVAEGRPIPPLRERKSAISALPSVTISEVAPIPEVFPMSQEAGLPLAAFLDMERSGATLLPSAPPYAPQNWDDSSLTARTIDRQAPEKIPPRGIVERHESAYLPERAFERGIERGMPADPYRAFYPPPRDPRNAADVHWVLPAPLNHSMQVHSATSSPLRIGATPTQLGPRFALPPKEPAAVRAIGVPDVSRLGRKGERGG